MKSSMLAAACFAAAWSVASWAQATKASSPALTYRPVLEGYRPYEAVEPGSWRIINGSVTPAAKPAAPAASSPDNARPAQPSAPASGSHEGHH